MKKFVLAIALFSLWPGSAVSDPPVDGSEFTFVRIQFNMRMTSRFQREAPWHHDFPFSEDFFLTTLNQLTTIRASKASYRILKMDDPEIFRYPWIYVSEPGYMDLTDKESKNLREYLLRGGFMLFDDFRGRDMDNLRYQMKKVLPEREFGPLDITDPLFNTFYQIESLDVSPPYGFDPPRFWALRDDKDRIQMIANHNNDFGEFWEWVDRGEMPFKPAAESVKFGVNYLMYALTH